MILLGLMMWTAMGFWFGWFITKDHYENKIGIMKMKQIWDDIERLHGGEEEE